VKRADGRELDQLRPLAIEPGFIDSAHGSVLFSIGKTRLVCTAMVEESVPGWMRGRGTGWVPSEYGMLPGSTSDRKPRDASRGKLDGRTVEIQRLIGRALRGIVDTARLGERTVWVDCDVIEADGGTRTASITGAFVAVADALRAVRVDGVLTDSVAAVSVGIVEGQPRLDLEYVEDRDAEVDLNLVMTGSGKFIEVQGTGEEATFTRDELTTLLDLGSAGVKHITKLQKQALGKAWPIG